jgi:fructose-1,6-bisphosphatase
MGVDMFHLLVCLCSSIHYLTDEKVRVANFLSKERLENMFNSFIWVMRAHCVQVLFAKIVFGTFEQISDEELERESKNGLNEDMVAVNDLFEFIIESMLEGTKQVSDSNQSFDDYLQKLKQSTHARTVYFTMKKAILPFLRCSYLFFSSLTHKAVSIEQIKNKSIFVFF